MLNKVMLIGRLGRSEVRNTNSGSMVANCASRPRSVGKTEMETGTSRPSGTAWCALVGRLSLSSVTSRKPTGVHRGSPADSEVARPRG